MPGDEPIAVTTPNLFSSSAWPTCEHRWQKTGRCDHHMNGDLYEWYKCEACGDDGFWKSGAANIVKKWEPSDMTVY